MKFIFDFFIFNVTYKIILSVVSFSFPFLFFLKMDFWLSFPTFDANPCPDISVECCWQVFVCHSFPVYVLEMFYKWWRCKANIFEIWFCLSIVSSLCFADDVKIIKMSSWHFRNLISRVISFQLIFWISSRCRANIV